MECLKCLAKDYFFQNETCVLTPEIHKPYLAPWQGELCPPVEECYTQTQSMAFVASASFTASGILMAMILVTFYKKYRNMKKQVKINSQIIQA